jgi:hypothetical protein
VEYGELCTGVAQFSLGGYDMATENESYVELFHVSKKVQVGKLPLASIRFIPRIGERIFLPIHGPRDWDSYTVVAVEYFLDYDPSTGKAARPESGGMDRITLYVEESK